METYEERFIKLAAMCVTYFVTLDATVSTTDDGAKVRLLSALGENRKEITKYIQESM
jgi:hypothetical protein